MDWIFGPIDESVRKEDFDGGVPELNDYLKKLDCQNHRRGIATTFVAIPQDGDGRVAGYYSISMGEIKREYLPEKYRRGLPRYPIPALRMGKLAVDQSMQGKGLGKELLMQCFRKAVRLSSEVGIFAVTVDALNEPAKQFYMNYGFVPLENDRLSLFLPLSTILRGLE